MGTFDDVRRRLLAGERPYALVKDGFARTTVYTIYNKVVQDGDLIPGSSVGYIPPEVDIGPEAETDEPESSVATITKPYNPITVKRATATATGKAADVINFAGAQNLPRDAVNAVRGAMGMAVVPSVLRMPMPEMLYIAMVTSISEMGWPSMQPQDFIDTVLYQWLDACGFITRPIVKKSDLQDIVDKANTFDPNSPALKKYISDNQLVPLSQVQAMIDLAIAKVKGNGNGNGNGHGEVKTEEVKAAAPVATPAPIDNVAPASVGTDTIVPKEGIDKPVVPIVGTGESTESVPDSASRIASTHVQDLTRNAPLSNESILANIQSFPPFATVRLKGAGIITLGQLRTCTLPALQSTPELGNIVVAKIVDWLMANKFELQGVGNTKEDNKDDGAGSPERNGEQNHTQPQGGGGASQNQVGGNPQPA